MTQRGDGPVDGSPAQVDGPQSRRSLLESWVRQHKLLTGLLSAVVLAVAIVIVVTVSGGGGTTSASHSVVGSKAASAPEAAAVTKGAKWITGTAGKALTTVTNDLGRLSAAERAGKSGAAKVAGTQLAADARAALHGPMPPVDAKLYRSALTDFERAGTYAASGALSKAAPFLNAGEVGITKVTAAVNTPAPVNPPAAVGEPHGQ